MIYLLLAVLAFVWIFAAVFAVKVECMQCKIPTGIFEVGWMLLLWPLFAWITISVKHEVELQSGINTKHFS